MSARLFDRSNQYDNGKEPTALNYEAEKPNIKLAELTEEELKQISGSCNEPDEDPSDFGPPHFYPPIDATSNIREQDYTENRFEKGKTS